MYVTVDEAPQITNITTTLLVGGSLEPNTTYYGVIVGYKNSYITNIREDFAVHTAITPDSTFSFTTDSTHLSVNVNYEGNRYVDWMIKKTPGDDWSDISSYCTIREKVCSYGSLSFNIISEPIQTGRMMHGAQFNNPYYGGIDKNISSPQFFVYVEAGDDETNTGIKELFEAIVALGYSTHVRFDGQIFVLMGSLAIKGNGSILGTFYLRNTTMVFLHGGFRAQTIDNKFVEIGSRRDPDNYPATAYYPSRVVNLIIHSTRYFLSFNDNSSMYGGEVKTDGFEIKDNINRINNRYYNRSYRNAQLGSIENYYASTNSIALYQIRGKLKNKPFFYQFNDFTKCVAPYYTAYYDSNTHVANWSYSKPIRFYRCGVIFSSWQTLFSHGDTPGDNNFYDCNFRDGLNEIKYVRWYSYGGTPEQSGSTNYYYNLVKNSVLGENGEYLENVTITAKDNFGNNVLFYSQNGDDGSVTYNDVYEIKTDQDGNADYYVMRSKDINTDLGGGGYRYNRTIVHYYPFTFYIKKDGYEIRSFIVSELNHPKSFVTVLPKIKRTKTTLNGNLLILNKPELGLDSDFLEI